MGACYSVYLRVKVKDEQKAVLALQEHIKDDTRTNYSLEEREKLGITPDTFDGLMRIFLADWGGSAYLAVTYFDGWREYENDFDASYGWGSVLLKLFEVMRPYLEKGSEMIVDADGEKTRRRVPLRRCSNQEPTPMR